MDVLLSKRDVYKTNNDKKKFKTVDTVWTLHIDCKFKA